MVNYNNEITESNYYLNNQQTTVIQAKEAKKLLLEQNLKYIDKKIKSQINSGNLDFKVRFDESIIEDVKTHLISLGYKVRRNKWLGDRTFLFITVR